MQFSANLSMLFTEVPMPERFVLARQHGFSAVEIQFPYQWPAADIKQWLDDNALSLVLFNVDADTLLQGGEGLAAVPSKRQQFQAALHQAADYATILQPHCINVLPGRCLDPSQTQSYLDCLQSNLFLACEILAPLNVIPVFEAINLYDMPNFLVHNHAGMLAIMKAVGHPVLKLQYDIYHMARMEQDISAFWRTHLSDIAHIQFADCPGRHEPGSGMLDFTSLFGQLDGQDYQGWIGAEYRPSSVTAASFNWLNRSA